jgi:hypothetical protein
MNSLIVFGSIKSEFHESDSGKAAMTVGVAEARGSEPGSGSPSFAPLMDLSHLWHLHLHLHL